MLTTLNSKLANSKISDVQVTDEYIAILRNEELWYYGDYKKLVSGKDSQTCELICLNKDVVKISCSKRTIAALDVGGKVLLWGRCVSNDAQNIDSPQFGYYEKLFLAKNAKNIFVSDSCICYIDETGCSHIYYSTGWPSFYGNSTKDSCVGIERTPSTWIRQ